MPLPSHINPFFLSLSFLTRYHEDLKEPIPRKEMEMLKVTERRRRRRERWYAVDDDFPAFQDFVLFPSLTPPPTHIPLPCLISG